MHFTYLSRPLLSVMPAFSECLACRVCIAPDKSLTARPGNETIHTTTHRHTEIVGQRIHRWIRMHAWTKIVKLEYYCEQYGPLHAWYSAMQFCNQICGDSKLGHLHTLKHTYRKEDAFDTTICVGTLESEHPSSEKKISPIWTVRFRRVMPRRAIEKGSFRRREKLSTTYFTRIELRTSSEKKPEKILAKRFPKKSSVWIPNHWKRSSKIGSSSASWTSENV
jgi:hypothetical protein